MIEKYIYLVCPFVTLIICTLIKNIIEIIKNKKIDKSRIFDGCGGMPSCHTAFSSSLATIIGLNIGFATPLFALALIFTLITSYDAISSRYEVGVHAEIFNKMIDEKKINCKKLKEKIGHKKIEVFIGLIIGIITGYIFSII